MVLGGFGWFRVLVTKCVQVTIRVAAVIEAVIANTCNLIRNLLVRQQESRLNEHTNVFQHSLVF